MTETKYPKKYFISGFQVHQAKKVCQFFFGDYFIDIKMNEKEAIFEVILEKSIKISGKDTPISEALDLKDFKDFWGPQWKLIHQTHNTL